MTRITILTILAGIMVSNSIIADHDPAHELPKMQVTASQDAISLTTPSIEDTRAELDRVPGGVKLIEAGDFKTRAVGNIADVLQLSPGVFAQSRFGGAETRMSIRGSGITQTFGVRGIRFLRDGLPVTNASGFTNPELIDPNTAHYIEVFRGANALEYGSATLGGAVNFVSRNGINSPGVSIRFLTDTEHNFYRPQIMGGTTLGENFDIFASISGLTQDGFRDQSHEDIKRGYMNIGYRHSDTVETRLHVIANDNRLELPGSLRKAQLLADPTRTAGSAFRDLGTGEFGDQLFDWEAHNASRNLERYRGELQHGILLSDSEKLGVGAWYESRDLDHPLPFVIIDTESNEAGLSFRYENQGQLFNNDNRLVVGGLYAWGQSNGKNFDTIFGGGDAVKNGLRSRTADESYTLEWFGENQNAITADVNLAIGAQVVHAKRRETENFIAPVATDTKNSRSYTGFSPKLGLVWQATDTVQVFGNASRNYEPPTTLEFGAEVMAAQGKLDAQESTVLEIGTRGAFGTVNWDLAFYHAWLKDEILLRGDPGQLIAQNADDTRHMGVELGLNAIVPLGLLGDDNLSFRSVYTYNNFEFDGDAVFGNNKLPGIPENFGTLEILYNHPWGFYVGPNVQYADNYFVDYANTQQADSYTIYGVRAGYQFAEKYTVFFEGRNLTDRKWISNTEVDLNSMGGDPRVFNPGYDRNFFFGFTIDLP